MPPASHAPLCTRQGAYAFNQPLSLNTSTVTNMQYMFQVRSAPAHTPSRLLARLSPSHLCLPWTRQNARAFNQPLSFDTSSVPNMAYMFQVRSAPAHATHSPVGPTPRVTWAAAPTPSRLLARLPPSHLCLPFGLGRKRMRSTSR